MAVREILLLGNPKLFERCEPVQATQLGLTVYWRCSEQSTANPSHLETSDTS